MRADLEVSFFVPAKSPSRSRDATLVGVEDGLHNVTVGRLERLYGCSGRQSGGQSQSGFTGGAAGGETDLVRGSSWPGS